MALSEVLFGQGQRPVVNANQITGKISLNGVLDEEEWKQATSIDGLTMVEPETGKPASMGTTVKILMDKRNIYLGITCYEDDP